MFARREDFELARKAIRQLEETQEALIVAWADAWYRSSVGYLTRADARAKAEQKFRKEYQSFEFSEMEDFKVTIEEALEALPQP